MKHKKLRKKLGSELRRIRESINMPQDVVIECLKDYEINCSKPNLSKIERDLISCRTDIFGALCLIYDVNPNIVLYQ